jgi:hypothetical protein
MELRLDSVGGVREWQEPSVAPFDHGRPHSVRYEVSSERPGRTFNVAALKSPPRDLLLSVEIAQEEGVFYMRAVEVDVSVEGDNPAEVLRGLSESVKDWLEFLRDEKPALASHLEGQERYVALLDFHPLTWFRARTIE